MTWWLYISIVILLFFVLLVGHVIVRKINEVRLRRLRHQYEHQLETTWTQTSFVVETKYKSLSKDILQDKRTSKSVSLVFSNNNPAYTDLREIVTDDDKLDKIICDNRKSDTSTKLAKVITRFASVEPATPKPKGQSHTLKDLPSSKSLLIKNASPSKRNIFEKSYTVTTTEISAPVKDKKKELSKTEPKRFTKDTPHVSLETDKALNKNLQKPFQNSKSNNNPTTSAESPKYKKTVVVTNHHQSSPKKKKPLKGIEIFTPKGSFTSKPPSKTTLVNVHAINRKTVTISDTILPAQKDENAHSSNTKLIIPKESLITKPTIKPNDDKINDESVKRKSPYNDILFSMKDNKYFNEFVKAKDSIAKMLRFDKNFNKNDDVNNSKDDAKTVTLTSDTDVTKERNNICTSNNNKEPSSLFFASLAPYKPSTPKEMFSVYENALKSEKTDSYGNNTNPETEFKHDVNIKASASKVGKHPKIQTSYVQIKDDRLVSKSGTSNSVSNCNLNEASATKYNLLKKISKVTFAKNEIIIKDSDSHLDHVCVINPATVALDELKGISSNEPEIDSECSKSEEPSTANLDKTVKDDSHKTTKDNKASFRSDFISEIVNVTNILFDKSHRNTGRFNDAVDELQTSNGLQSTKRTEKDFLSQVDMFKVTNQKLASRSLDTLKTVESASFNTMLHSEVIIVASKSGAANGKVVASKAQKATSEPIVKHNKEIIEIKEKIASLSKFLKSMQDSTKFEHNKNEDDDTNAGT